MFIIINNETHGKGKRLIDSNITDNEAGQRLVFDFTASLVEHVVRMVIAKNTEVTLTA